jgi:hypothetical protein
VAVSVRLIGVDGFGAPLWDDRVPWLDGLRLLDAFDYELVDHLTRRVRISRADALALLDGGKPLPWHEARAAELRQRVWNAATREIDLVLEEW